MCRRQVDQGNEDAEKAQNVDNEDDDFDGWKGSADEYVDENTKKEHCPQKERPVPALTREIFGIIQTDQL